MTNELLEALKAVYEIAERAFDAYNYDERQVMKNAEQLINRTQVSAPDHIADVSKMVPVSAVGDDVVTAVYNALGEVVKNAVDGSSLSKLLPSQRMALTRAAISTLQVQDRSKIDTCVREQKEDEWTPKKMRKLASDLGLPDNLIRSDEEMAAMHKAVKQSPKQEG
jgi:hypothetical protein